MKKLKELYQQSLQELCHTKTVVLCGLLAALAIVLSMVASIQLGQDRLFRAAKPHR